MAWHTCAGTRWIGAQLPLQISANLPSAAVLVIALALARVSVLGAPSFPSMLPSQRGLAH